MQKVVAMHIVATPATAALGNLFCIMLRIVRQTYMTFCAWNTVVSSFRNQEYVYKLPCVHSFGNQQYEHEDFLDVLHEIGMIMSDKTLAVIMMLNALNHAW